MQKLNTQILEPQSKMEEALRSIWRENNFALDIPIIDLHHTWLVWLLLQLENESNKPDSPESIERIDSIISDLVNFVTEHFWVEECLLDYAEFPETKKHLIQHRGFVEEISQNISYRQINTNEQISEFIRILKEWLIKHILVEDTKYKEFFLKERIDTRPFFDDLMKNQKSVLISKDQANLFNRISGNDNMVEVISRDIATDVHKIWKAYSLGLHIPTIDTQHLWLVKVLVELERANRTDNARDRDIFFKKSILEMINYARDHFLIEEAVMKEFGYPDYNKHIREHKNFIEFINFRNLQKKDGVASVYLGMVNDLKQWLISHVAIEDKQMAVYLRDSVKEVEEFISIKTNENIFSIKPEHKRFYIQIQKMLER